MAEKLEQITFKVKPDTKKLLEKIAAKSCNGNTAALVRKYIEKGLKVDGYKDEEQIILTNMKTALSEILMPQIERLAAIEAKGAVSSTTALLTTLLFLQLIVEEKSRPQTELVIDKARRYAINFVRSDKGSIDKFLHEAVNAILAQFIDKS
jgi:hypothetical protein